MDGDISFLPHGSSSLESAGGNMDAGARRNGTSALVSEVREELHRLNSRLSRLGTTSSDTLDMLESSKDLETPVRTLEHSLAALRDAANSRFQLSELRVDVFEADNDMLEDELYALRKDVNRAATIKAERRETLAARSERSGARSRRHSTPESEASESTRQSRRRREERRQERREERRLRREKERERSQERRTRKERRKNEERKERKEDRRARKGERTKDYEKEEEAEFKPGQSSGSRSRPRSDSPDARPAKRPRPYQDMLAQAVSSSSALAEAVSFKSRNTHFMTPQWASSTALQSQPLPEDAELAVSVVLAFIHAGQRLPHKKLPNAYSVMQELAELSPGCYQRYNVAGWEELLVRAQQTVSLHVFMPPFAPLAGANERLGTALVILTNLDQPFYSAAVHPPSLTQQLAGLRQQAEVPHNIFREQRPKAHASRFPALLPSAAPSCVAYLQEPRNYFVLADVLVELSEPDKCVLIATLAKELRARLTQQFASLIDACQGIKRYLGMAAHYLKLRPTNHTQLAVSLEAAEQLWWDPRVDAEYRAYRQARLSGA